MRAQAQLEEVQELERRSAREREAAAAREAAARAELAEERERNGAAHQSLCRALLAIARDAAAAREGAEGGGWEVAMADAAGRWAEAQDKWASGVAGAGAGAGAGDVAGCSPDAEAADWAEGGREWLQGLTRAVDAQLEAELGAAAAACVGAWRRVAEREPALAAALAAARGDGVGDAEDAGGALLPRTRSEEAAREAAPLEDVRGAGAAAARAAGALAVRLREILGAVPTADSRRLEARPRPRAPPARPARDARGMPGWLRPPARNARTTPPPSLPY